LASVVSLMTTFSLLQTHNIARDRVSPIRSYFPLVAAAEVVEEVKQQDLLRQQLQQQVRQHLQQQGKTVKTSYTSTGVRIYHAPTADTDLGDDGDDDDDDDALHLTTVTKHPKAISVFYLVTTGNIEACKMIADHITEHISNKTLAVCRLPVCVSA
jgi:hypothetical protein